MNKNSCSLVHVSKGLYVDMDEAEPRRVVKLVCGMMYSMALQQ